MHVCTPREHTIYDLFEDLNMQQKSKELVSSEAYLKQTLNLEFVEVEKIQKQNKQIRLLTA